MDSVQVVELDPDPEQKVQTKTHQEVIEDDTGVEKRETTLVQKEYKEGDSGVGHKEEIHITSDKALVEGGTVTGETSISCEAFTSDSGFLKKDQHTTHSVKLVDEPGLKQHQDTSTDQVCSVSENVEADGSSSRRVVTATREKVVTVKKRTAKITTPDGEVIETELPDDIAAIIASGGQIPPEFLAGKTVVSSSSSSSKHFETKSTSVGGQPVIETRELSDANASQLVDEIFSSIEKEHPEFELSPADKAQKVEGVQLEASVKTPDIPSLSIDAPGAVVFEGERKRRHRSGSAGSSRSSKSSKDRETSPSKPKKIFSFFGRKEGKDKSLDRKQKKDKRKSKEPDVDHPDVIVAESLEFDPNVRGDLVVNVTAPQFNASVDGVDTKKKSSSLPRDIDHLSPNKVKKRHKHRHKGRQKELIVGEVEEVTEEQRHSVLVEGPTSIEGLPSESESYTSESLSDEEDKKKKSHTLPRFGGFFTHKDKELKVKEPKLEGGVSGEFEVDGRPAEVEDIELEFTPPEPPAVGGDIQLEVTTPEPPTVGGDLELEVTPPEFDLKTDKREPREVHIDVTGKSGSLKRGIKNIKQSLSVGPRQEEVVFTGTEHFPEESKRPRLKVEKDRGSETSSEAGSQRDKGKKKHHSLKGIFTVKGPKVPEGEVVIGEPDVAIEIDKPSVEGDIGFTVSDKDKTSEDSKSETSSKGTFGKKFKIKLPKGHIKHDRQGEIVLGHSVDVTEEQKHPVAVETKLGVDVERPEGDLDIEGGKSGGIKFPSIHLPNIQFKGKQGEVVVGASDKVEEADKPKVAVEPGEIELPKGEISLEHTGPDIDTPETKKRKFNLGINLPKFHIESKGDKSDNSSEAASDGSGKGKKHRISGLFAHKEVEGRQGEIVLGESIDIPEGSLKRSLKHDIELTTSGEVTKPEVEGELKTGKSYKIKLPSFSLKGHDQLQSEVVVGADDVAVDELKPKDDSASVEFKDQEGPDIEVKGKKKFKLPSFHIKGRGPKGEIEGEGVELPEAEIDIDGKPKDHKFKLPGFHIKGRGPQGEIIEGESVEVTEGYEGPEGSKFKLPGFHIKGSGPKVEIEGEGHAEIPEGEIEIEGSPKGKKFKLPDISLPEFHLKGRGPKGEVEGDASVELPEGELDVEGGKGKKFKLPGFHIKGRGPQGEIVEGGSVEIPEGQVEVEVEGSPKGGKFKLPDFNLPEFHLKGRGPKGEVEGDAGVDLPEGEVDVEGGKGKKFKLPGFHIKGRGPQGEIVQEGSVEIPEGQVDVEVEGSPRGGKFKLPDFHLPEFHLKGRGPKGEVEGDASVELPEGEVDVEGGKGKKFKLPGFHIKGRGPQGEIVQEGSVEIPEGQVDVEVKGSPKGGKFKLPDFNLPEFHLKGRGPKGEVEGDASVELPEGEVDVEGGKGKKFKLPGFHIKGRGPQGEIVQEGSVEIPEGQVDVEVKGSPKGGKFKLPDFNLPEFHLKGRGPKGEVEGDASVELPEGEVDVEGGKGKKFKLPGFHIKGRGPQGEIVQEGSVEIPEGQVDVEVKGSPKGGKFKLPDFHLPEFHLKGRGPKGELEGDASVELPEGEVDVEGGKGKKFKLPGFHVKGRGPQGEIVEGGSVEVPEGQVSVEVEGSPKGGKKFKLPDFHLPEFHLKGRGPKGDIDGEGSISVPSGEVDIEGSPKHRKKFKLPGFHIKGRRPKGDIDGEGSVSIPSGEVDIEGKPKDHKFKLPDFHIEGRAPQGEIIEGDSVEVTEGYEGPEGRKKFKLPGFHIKGSGPKVEVEGEESVSVPSGEVDIEGSSKKKKKFKLPGFHIKGRGPQGEIVQEGSVEIPEGELELEGSAKGGKKYKLPDFNLPEFHLKGRGPKGGIEGDASVDLPEGEVDVEGGKGKKFKLPGFHIKGRGPQGEIVQEGSVEIPEGQVEVEVEGSPKGGKKFKLPDFNLPEFHLKGRGPKGEVEGDASVEIPEGEVDVEGGKGKKFKLPGFHIKGRGPQGEIVEGGSVEIPEGQVEVEVEGSPKGGKFKLPDFNLPEFHLKGRGPKGEVEGDASVELPEGEVDVEGGKGKKFKLPGFHIKGRGPQGEIVQEGSVEIPEGQVDVEVEGSPKGGKFKLPDFNLPEFHLKGRGPKGEVEGDASVDLPEGEVDVEGGKGKKFKLPGFHIKGRGPQGEIVEGGSVEIPEGQVDVEVEGSPKGGKFKLPDFHLPEFHLKGRGPKGEVEGDASVELPEGEVDVEGGKGKKFKLPGFHIKGRGPQGEIVQEGSVEIPEGQVDVEVEGSPKGGKFKLPDFNLPEFHLKGRGPKGEVEGDASVELPEGEVDVEGGKGKKFKLPGFHIKGRGPQGEIVEGGSVEIPEGEVSVEVEGSPKGGKKFKLPDFSLPDIHIKGRGPKGEVEGGSIELPEGEVDIEGKPKDHKIKLPEFHIEGRAPQGEIIEGESVQVTEGYEGKKFKLPGFQIKGSAPDAEISGKAPSVDIDTDSKGSGTLKGKKKFKFPSFNIKGRGPKGEIDGEGSVSLPSGEVEVEGSPKQRKKFKLPGFHIKGRGPKVEVEGGESVSVPSGEVKIEGSPKGKKFKLPGFHIKGRGPQGEIVEGGSVEIPEGEVSVEVEGSPKGGKKFKLPDLSLPEFHLKGRGPKGEVEGDASVELPEGEVDVEGGKGKKFKLPGFHIKGRGPQGEIVQEGSVEIPEGQVDVEVEGSPKGGKFKLPDFHLPEFHLKGRGPKGGVEGDASVDLPEGEVDVEGGKGKKFKLPGFHIKGRGPQGEIVQEGSVEIPEGQVDVEVEGSPKGGKFKLPDFNLPEFHLKGRGPKGEVEGDASVELPEGEVDVEGGKGKKFKLPGFHIKGRGPQGEIVEGGSVEIPEGEVSVEVEGSPKGGKKFKLPDFNLPEFHLKGRGPKGEVEGDVGVELPEGDVDVEGGKGKKFKLPGFHIKGRGPQGEIVQESSVEIPEGHVKVEVEGSPKGGKKFKLPDFNLPEFHLKGRGPKGEVEGDASVELPEGEVDIEGGKGKKFKLPGFHIKGRGPQGEIVQEGSVEIPEGQIGVEVEGSPKGGKKFKLPDFNLPEFHLKGRGPKGEVEGDASVELPEGEVDVEGGKGKKFKLPGFHIKGRGPQGEIVQEGSVEVPEGELEVEVEGSPKGGKKFKLPDFNLPEFHLKGRGPKGEVEGGGKVEVPEGDLDIEGKPKDHKFKLPGFHIEGRGPQGEIIEGESVEVTEGYEGPEGQRKKFKLPGFHIKGSAPDVEISGEGPSVEADTDSKGSGTLKGKKKFKLPSLHLKGQKTPGEVIEVGSVEVTEGKEPSEADSASKSSGTPKTKKKKFKLPGFHVKGSLSQGEVVEAEGVEVKEGVEGPELEGEKKKFKLPGFHFKGSASGPQAQIVEDEGVKVTEDYQKHTDEDKKKFKFGIGIGGKLPHKDLKTPEGEIAIDESVDIKEHRPDIDQKVEAVDVKVDEAAPDVQIRATSKTKTPKLRLSFPHPKDHQEEIIVGETTQIKEAHRQFELDEIPVEGEGQIEGQHFEILPEELEVSAKADYDTDKKSHTFPRPHLPKVHLTLTRGDRERQSELVHGEQEHVVEGKIDVVPPVTVSTGEIKPEAHVELEGAPEGELQGDISGPEVHKTKHKFHIGGGFGFGGKKKDRDSSIDPDSPEGVSGEGDLKLEGETPSLEVQKTKKLFHIKGLKGKKDRDSKGSSSGEATPSADFDVSIPEGGTLREVRKTKEIFHISGKGPKVQAISVEGSPAGEISVEGVPKDISIEGGVPEGATLQAEVDSPELKVSEGGVAIHEVRTTKHIYHIGGSGGDKPEGEEDLSHKEKTGTGKKLRGLFHIDKKVKGPELDVSVTAKEGDKESTDRASDKASSSSRSSSPGPGKSHKFSFGGIFGGKGKKRNWRKRSKKDSEGEAKAYPDEEPVPASKSVNIVGQEGEHIEFIPIEAKGELQATPGSISIGQNGQIERSVEFPGGTIDIDTGGVTTTTLPSTEHQKNIQNGLDKPSVDLQGRTPGFEFTGGGFSTDHTQEHISSTRDIIVKTTSPTVEMGGTTSSHKTEHSEHFQSGDGPHMSVETKEHTVHLQAERPFGQISVDTDHSGVHHDISSSSHSTTTYHLHGPATPSTSQSSPAHTLNESFDAAVTTTFSHRSSVDSGTGSDPSRPPGHFVIVAIDFGTTYSGYAFSFTRDPEAIHMMRKWEGGDPGVINQKTPTSLLLTPQGEFHSFGFTARDFFHDLSPEESRQWLYFEKFKMALHYNADLNKDTMLTASNGKEMPALAIFSHALRYFKEHSLQELTDQSSTKILNEDVRWVISVPAIWKAPAKQFMRQAAYNAGIASAEYPDQLLIALEPEAASIYCRKLRMHQLVPERPIALPLSPKRSSTPEPNAQERVSEGLSDDSRSQYSLLDDSNIPDIYYATPETPTLPRTGTSTAVTPIGPNTNTVGGELQLPGTRYMVVDCGGGTVDITVHEMESRHGNLKELYKASGGPYGSVGVDMEFEKLLIAIFGKEFINQFRYKRPAGYVDLMIAFESRKRAASPYKSNPLNVSLPFSFIDYYKKTKNSQVESAIRKYGNKDIRWSSQGMLRLMPSAMRLLFQPTLEKIKQAIGDVLNNPAVRDISYLFLVGGFAESPMLQYEVRKDFGDLMRIIIPQDVGLTILKGAVCFGLDPAVVSIRRSRLTYGVGVLNRFNHDKHPKEKLVAKDGHEWCTDVFDRFVVTDQPIALGDTVLRSYTPAKLGQKASIINIYATEESKVRFITDRGVKKCGTLILDLSDIQYAHSLPKRREIQTRMTFGDTEIKVSALDVATGKCVKAGIDFLNK